MGYNSAAFLFPASTIGSIIKFKYIKIQNSRNKDQELGYNYYTT